MSGGASDVAVVFKICIWSNLIKRYSGSVKGFGMPKKYVPACFQVVTHLLN